MPRPTVQTDEKSVRAKLDEELSQIPEEKLAELYDQVRHYRLRTEGQRRKERIMNLAGSWKDMPKEDFTSFYDEIAERRRLAAKRVRRA